MPAAAKLLITSIGATGAIFILGTLAHVVIQAIRGGGRLETDFVLPHELSLLGLSVSFACLIGYTELPKQICPIAQTELEGISMLAGLVLFEIVLFTVSMTIAGKVARKQRLEQYGDPNRWIIAFGIFYRNLTGLVAIVSVGILLLIGRF